MAKVTIIIDGKDYEVEDDKNLLQIGLSLGFDLPYFCWHPCMGSVGSCRQCACKEYQNKEDEQGRVVMSCMTSVRDGANYTIDDEESKQFRADIIELLMTNHPHDCPVCEEGGECHLQDMTLMSGHSYRRYRGKKRTHENQQLGPFINHEMNRCITCYRCMRFYQDYAGGKDLQAMGSAHNVYFGRHEDGTLENEFSGNLVEVCPTGVFTDKTLSKHYSRKWDLQTAPSICTHCAQGCNTSPGERYGVLRRIVNRYHGDVNGYFICDRGRFGYDFANSDQRLYQAQLIHDAVDGQAVVEHIANECHTHENKTIAIGSPRASLEANFALKTLVGENNFYGGLSATEQQLVQSIADIYQTRPVTMPTIKETEQADVVLILGEDVPNTAARLGLAIRQANRNKSYDMAAGLRIPVWDDSAVRELAQDEKSPLYIITPAATRLDELAALTANKHPDDIARIAYAIAHALNADAPAVSDLTDEEQEIVKTIAAGLKTAKKPLIVSGTGCQHDGVVSAAANIAMALTSDNQTTDLYLCIPEVNSLGAAMLSGTDTLDHGLQHLQNGEADTVIILENDLYRRAKSSQVSAALKKARNVIVLDHINSKTVEMANGVLPVGIFAEVEGTFVSNEGRAQRYFPVYVAKDSLKASWQWLAEVAELINHPDAEKLQHVDSLTQACEESLAFFKDITQAAPTADFRKTGRKLPRMTHRASGRTAMLADINVSEPKQPEDAESALGFTMEGYYDQAPNSLRAYTWAPRWNSNQSVHKFQDEAGGDLTGGNPGIRLMNMSADAKINWFDHIPSTFKANGSKPILPMYEIFGGEELSSLAEAVAERADHPYIAINAEYAGELGVKNGDGVEVAFGDESYQLEVRVQADMAIGTVGMPMGLIGMENIQLYALESPDSIKKAENWIRKTPELITTDRTD